MDDREINPDVPAEEPEDEFDLDDLDEEPVPVFDEEPEWEDEAVLPVDRDLEPDTGAVLIGDTYEPDEPDLVEAEPPPFLEADRVDEPEWDDLTDEMAAEEGVPDLGPEPVLESAPPEPVVTRPATPPPPPFRPAVRDTAPRRDGVGWGGVLAIGLLSALAGAALALLVLFALNGSLFYPRNRDRAQDQEIARLAGELSRVETRFGTVDSRLNEVEGLNTRVDEVEGRVGTLGGDVDTIGGNVETLQADVADALEGVDTVQGNLEAVATRTAGIGEDVDVLSEEVTGIGEQVGVLEAVADRFDLFLAGLRDLLDRAGAPPDGEAVPLTVTPIMTDPVTVTPLPSPTVVATATPGADVTVIPLATPTP